MNAKTHYDTLGVVESASAEEIKRAFRERAKQHHPDRNPDDPRAVDRFKAVAAAHNVLSDQSKRAAYDQELHFARENVRAAAARAAASAATPRSPTSVNSSSSVPRSQPGPGISDIIVVGAAAIGFGAFLSAFLGEDGGGGYRGSSRERSGRSRLSRWDSRARRYRDSDGRFTSG